MDNSKKFINRIDWVNTLFLFISPLIAVVGTVFLIWTHAVQTPTVILGVVMALLTGLAVTAGYHRLFAHKSYEASRLFKAAMLIFGSAAFENSARRWASDHRNHHKFVDTDRDPYNINRGFFFAHMGWVCLKYDVVHRYDNVKDLEGDKLIAFQEKYLMPLGIGVGFLMPTLIASLWGDPLGGLILAGFLRLVLNHHFTFSINSFCHMLGRQPYSDQNTARDSWFLALFTYGEGYHNFHHKFPSDYRNGIRFYHWDPTKWLVKALSWFNMTNTLRKISDHKILLARIRMDERRAVRKLIKEQVHSHPYHLSEEWIKTARLKFEEAYIRFHVLKHEYAKLKGEKMEAFSVRLAHVNERIETLKNDLHKARESFNEARASWVNLCRSLGVRPSIAAA